MRYGVLSILLAFAAFCCPPARAAMMDDEARASEIVQRRLQAALDRRFGPGLASAEATVRLKLSNRARGWVAQLLAPPQEGGGISRFEWEWLSQRAKSGGKYVLPGIPQEGEKAPEAGDLGPPPVTAAAEVLRSFETEIQNMSVRVVLDASLPEGAEAAAKALAEEVSGASPVRGDVVAVERAALPTPVQKALRDPAVLSQLAGHAAKAGLALAALLAAAFVALVLSRSFRRGAESMAAALRHGAGRRISVAVEGGAAGLLAGGPRPELEEGEAGPEAAQDAEEEKEDGEIVVEIGVEHVPRLAHLLKDQSPQNVALVMPHLKPEVRNAYLSAIPRDAAAGVLLAMAPVRYVDPQLLRTLKDELERRVRGVVGGPDQAAEMVKSLGEAERKAVLERLKERSPEAAAAIRGKVLLFEDLAGFGADALARIASALGPEEAAAAAASADEGLREAFAKALPGRAGRVFQETVDILRSSPDPVRERAAQEKALKEVEELIRSGRVKRPVQPALAGAIAHHGGGGLPGPSGAEPWRGGSPDLSASGGAMRESTRRAGPGGAQQDPPPEAGGGGPGEAKELHLQDFEPPTMDG